MRLRRVTQPVNHLNGGVDGGVIANRILGAGDVVVNRPGDAHNLHPLPCQVQGSPEGAVSPHDNQGVGPMARQRVKRLFLAGRRHKLVGTRGVKHGSAPVDDVRHRAQLKLFDLIVNQPLIPAQHAQHAAAPPEASAHGCPDGGVHAGGISPRRENGNGGSSLFHGVFPLFFNLSSVVCANCPVCPAACRAGGCRLSPHPKGCRPSGQTLSLTARPPAPRSAPRAALSSAHTDRQRFPPEGDGAPASPCPAASYRRRSAPRKCPAAP